MTKKLKLVKDEGPPVFEVGDRVKDAYKAPRKGDQCVTGTVLAYTPEDVIVKWDEPDSIGRHETHINPFLLVKV